MDASLEGGGSGPRDGRRRQRGAALVEFGIVAVLLFTLVFGIVDFGSAYNDYISVRQGTRDGVRQAVTGRIGSDSICDITGSSLSATDPRRLVICLTKARVGLDETDTRVSIDVNAPVDGSHRGSIAVCVMYPLRSITGFFPPLDGKVVRTEVQMRTEQKVTEADEDATVDLTDYSETPVSGQSWTFCVAEDT